ncbi:MAG: type III-A CRISPR-associated protein Cas10/Csm1 [Deltaproteobacteria bacterium]|nr:type III-A CRISPR-associated protein Cas10/Csm1 [Deltaproteobacteria bacterium]
MKDVESLALGVLWHDIGKFKQRARYPEDSGRSHVEIGVEWLENHYGRGRLSALVSTHHASSRETWESNDALIGYEADNCAASERKTYDPEIDRYTEWQHQICLANIFGRVADPRRLGDPSALPPPSYLPLKPLGSWIEPCPDEAVNSPETYRSLWEQFEREFAVLKDRDQHHNLELILHLLEKYTSHIPAITLKIYSPEDRETYRKHPDISLFDHSKTAAALAVCLYAYHREKHAADWPQRVLKEEIAGPATWEPGAEAPFLLVGGDISGVQKFIYTIASAKALKSLKGRSFFLELLAEHVVSFLLESLELTRCNVLFIGGGHFYLLAPNLDKVRHTLGTVSEAVNDYLWKTANGQLQIFTEAAPMNKAQLAQTSQVWGELSGRLEEAKRRRWETHLEELLADPASPHPDCLTDKCTVCGREDLPLHREEDMALCGPCLDQLRLGDYLQRALREGRHPALAVWHDRPEEHAWVLPVETGSYRRYYLPVKDLRHLRGKLDGALHLNTWEMAEFTLPGSRPLLSATYHYREFADLESLVNEGFGMGMAAVLRMDVDHLGKIFSHSLAAERDTLARKTSLSRQLSLFFKFHLDGILKGAENGYETLPRHNLAGRPLRERCLSVVYSGGDDLFLLGHWLDVLEAGLDIQQAFARFTCNPYITLSAGQALAPPHAPIYRLARLAGELESLAKKAGGMEKSRIAYTGNRIFRWEDFPSEVLQPLEILGEFLQCGESKLVPVPDGLGRGVFFRLMQVCRDHKGQGVWRFPRLAWLFGRLKPRNRNLHPAWQKLQNYIFHTEVSWQGLETALMWTLMMMRKGELP